MTRVTIEETKQIPLRSIFACNPIADVPLSYDSMDKYIRWSEQVFTVKVDGEVASVWGIIRPSILSGEGYLWLLTTTIAEDHKFVLLRTSQRTIEELLKTYTTLTGDCLIGDTKAQRWMRLLGAKFDFPTGKTIPFRIERR